MSDVDSEEEERINQVQWWTVPTFPGGLTLEEGTFKPLGPAARAAAAREQQRQTSTVRELEDPHKGKGREGYCNRCALACGTPMSYYEKAKTGGRISKRRQKTKGKKSKKSKKRRKKSNRRSQRCKKK
jgi:hypothetical protein